tara:strand:+ start:60 stop:437 length:378 start_codon:yes stop_codon:yes gene_type:complete
MSFSRKCSWHNIEGYVEIFSGDIEFDKMPKLETFLKERGQEDDAFDIHIAFKSSGHYEPGNMWGDSPCPDDFEDERELDFIDVDYYDDNGERVSNRLDDAHCGLIEEIWDKFEDKIYDVELDNSL